VADLDGVTRAELALLRGEDDVPRLAPERLADLVAA